MKAQKDPSVPNTKSQRRGGFLQGTEMTQMLKKRYDRLKEITGICNCCRGNGLFIEPGTWMLYTYRQTLGVAEKQKPNL